MDAIIGIEIDIKTIRDVYKDKLEDELGGLQRIAGTWTGSYKRDDNPNVGGVETVFTIANGQLRGWHYQQSWVMENVSVSGNVVKFTHVYDAPHKCRALHEFTISSYETRKALSKYRVECPHGHAHTGTITYRK